MSDPLHIVSFSGGKDSTAMLVRMLELKMPVDLVLFADTFFEFEVMYEFHDSFKRWMGKYYPDIPMKTIATEATFDQWDLKDLKGRGYQETDEAYDLGPGM
jgi:3'-phosphoadenosine 5'-phosphosulfate sulfotransferase (PAPS reductase)/FAD synthetase